MADASLIVASLWMHKAIESLLEIEASASSEVFDSACLSANERAKYAKKMARLFAKARPASESASPLHLDAFDLLFQFCLLESYEIAADDARTTLEDLCTCFRPLFLKDAANEDVSADSSSIDPFSVFTDVILSVLSRPTAFARFVATSVFRVFAEDHHRVCPVSRQALMMLADAVADTEADGGEDEESGSEDDDASDDASVELISDMEEEDERQLVSLDEFLKLTKEVEEEADEEEDDEDDGKLESARKRKRSDEPAEEGDEDDDWDDARMFRLDAKLAEMLRSQKRQKLENRAALAERTNFKIRVLELLELFVKKQDSNPEVLFIIAPLLVAAEATLGSAADREDVKRLTSHFQAVFKALGSWMKSTQLALDDGPVEQVIRETARLANSTSPEIVALYGSALVPLVRTVLHKTNCVCFLLPENRIGMLRNLF